MVVFVLYYLAFISSGERSRAEQCVGKLLENWKDGVLDKSVGIGSSSVSFIGNGHIGVDVNGELRGHEVASRCHFRLSFNGSGILNYGTRFKPLVYAEYEGSDSSADATLTEFATGRLGNIKCYSMKTSVTLKMHRGESKNWKMNKTGDAVVYTKTFPLHISSLSSAIMCSNIPREYIVSQQKEETIRFICIIEQRELHSNMAIDTLPAVNELTRKVIAGFGRISKELPRLIDNEHITAWKKLNTVTFYLSSSKAPNVLSGDKINATRYILLSNTKAPLLEEYFPEDKKKSLELSYRRNERCYSEHSTLLYPSKLWQDWTNINDLLHMAEIWLLTLDKRGCSSMLKSGATGLAQVSSCIFLLFFEVDFIFCQAFTLSLSGASYHDSHLEVSLSLSDLHRELAFGGLPIGIDVGEANARVRIDKDNTPFFEVSSTRTLYACGGGCLGEPLTLGKTPAKIPIKITKPETSILYIATDRKHLEQLRSTIHVSEVLAAPSHENDLMALHKHGATLGGLPTWLWFFLVVLLITFHAFLAKLLWSEWRKGDMTPYNPYLRNSFSTCYSVILQSFAGFLDIARKDIDVPKTAANVLLAERHLKFITNYEKNKGSYDYIMSEPLRLSGIYWCVAAVFIQNEQNAFNRDEIIQYIRECQLSDGGFAPAACHDSHLLHTLSAIQVFLCSFVIYFSIL
ncbi:prenyltransferase and squalene oxidase repeat-containing domain protein [Dictyocaulus viviparus]|uniref:Prenyltransferase and squalene oxidase repeat-containing domain protein n=1 Tax=Dictyocaulus viviparus TaxID=29172 RepID=A0A0D8Y674_DICVI|nr:prenyltransferase and squalene oxidase repeat-containing domain protein [Dictyocaulus viviparus]